MKKRTADHKVVRSEEYTEGTFGIDKKHLAHIFEVLRKSLYSNSVHACVREYSTNADDAQKEAGTTKPFDVWLPTQLVNEFRVRDYGIGLDVQEVFETYCMYGTSTKRHSNEYNGMLGLGSKSGFSYADNFAISSFKDGKKYIFNAYIDESLIGKVALMETLDTDEEDGVEIIIPVRSQDWRLFQEAAARLYMFFDRKPNLHNRDDYYYYNLDKPEVHYAGHGWYLPKSSNYSALAVMGNVAYPIDASHLKNDIARSLVSSSIIVEFAIGELDIAANREALQYTEITKKALNVKFESIVNELKSEMNKGLQECKNIWEAVLQLNNIRSFSKLSSHLASSVSQQLKWRDIDLNNYINKGFVRIPGVDIRYFSLQSYSGRLIQQFENTIFVDAQKTLVLNDEESVVLAPRIKLMLSEKDDKGQLKHKNGALVISFKDFVDPNGKIASQTAEEVKTKWMADNHLEEVPMINFSSLPKPEREKKEKTEKVSAYELVLKPNNYGDVYGVLEDCKLEVETASGLFFEINRGKVVHPDWVVKNSWGDVSKYIDSSTLASWLGKVQSALDIKKMPKIYGIKTALIKQKREAKKFSPKLKCAIDWARKKLREDIKKNDYTRIIHNDRINNSISDKLSYLSALIPYLQKNDGPMWDLVEKYKSTVLSTADKQTLSKIASMRKIAENFKMSFDDIKSNVVKEEDFSNMIKQVFETYPLLNHTGIGVPLGENYSYHLRKYLDGDVINKGLAIYIGAVDAELKKSETEDTEKSKEDE